MTNGLSRKTGGGGVGGGRGEGQVARKRAHGADRSSMGSHRGSSVTSNSGWKKSARGEGAAGALNFESRSAIPNVAPASEPITELSEERASGERLWYAP